MCTSQGGIPPEFTPERCSPRFIRFMEEKYIEKSTLFEWKTLEKRAKDYKTV